MATYHIKQGEVGGDGSQLTPYGTVQDVLDNESLGANGDLLLVQDNATYTETTSLDYSLFGDPTIDQPVVICGCDSSWVIAGGQNGLTRADISLSNVTWSTKAFVHYMWLSFTRTAGIIMMTGTEIKIHNCIFDAGGQTASLVTAGDRSEVSGCYFFNMNSSSSGQYCLELGNSAIAEGCYFIAKSNFDGTGVELNNDSRLVRCWLRADDLTSALTLVDGTRTCHITDCMIYGNTSGGTGINLGGLADGSTIRDCIITDFSGTGGKAIEGSASGVKILRTTYFSNDTHNDMAAADVIVDEGEVASSHPLSNPSSEDYDPVAANLNEHTFYYLPGSSSIVTNLYRGANAAAGGGGGSGGLILPTGMLGGLLG